MTLEGIREVIRRKRDLHPELDRPLTWHGLQRILARENVGLFVVPLPRPAQLVPFAGSWSILVNSRLVARRHTYYAAHELGHLWLHHDATAEREERCWNMDGDWPEDPREDEAELFAMMVLGEHPASNGDDEPPSIDDMHWEVGGWVKRI